MPEERLPKVIYNNTPNYGKRSRGRPRKTWITCVKEDAANFTWIDNVDIGVVTELAGDRKHWREMIHHERLFEGAGHSND